MKRRLGILCMCMGAVLLLGALTLFAYNEWESTTAEATANELLAEIKEAVQGTQPTSTPEAIKRTPGEGKSERAYLPDPTIDPTMAASKVRGYWCVGYLTIPALELELPVINSWSNENGKAGPCLYYGSTKTANMVLCAHSYRKYFGRIDELRPGDEVLFTDMNGVLWQYEVGETEILLPTDIEQMTAGEYALTLFSCTPQHNRRITVRCRAK